MPKLIQCELRTPTRVGAIHTLTWIPADLKPKAGMALICAGDSRLWTVVYAYTETPLEMDRINNTWRVGGLS